MNFNWELLKSIFLDAQNKTSRMAKLNFKNWWQNQNNVFQSKSEYSYLGNVKGYYYSKYGEKG